MLAGATGFIGSHPADAIEAAGHTLLWRAIRRARAVARNAAGRRSDGGSAQIFLQMAALPVILVPQGAGAVQPVHVDDLSALVVRLIRMERVGEARIPVVGQQAVEWADYLSALRAALGLEPARPVRIPSRWVGIAASISQRMPNAPLTEESWQMRQRSNPASADSMTRYLGEPPRSIAQFVTPAERRIVGNQARLEPLLAMLRCTARRCSTCCSGLPRSFDRAAGCRPCRWC